MSVVCGICHTLPVFFCSDRRVTASARHTASGCEQQSALCPYTPAPVTKHSMRKHPVPTRRELEKAAKTMPLEVVLGAQVTKGLTHKQKAFARKVAEGATKAEAYREAYDVTSPKTMRAEPYRLAAHPSVSREIEAYTLAIEAERQRTPASLRALVVHQLTRHALDQDVPPAVRISALRLLGQITEVAAFTERKEVRTITSSEDARRAVMQQIHQLMGAQVEDANVIGGEADDLLRELAETHPPGTPPVAEPESPSDIHTIPLKVSANFISDVGSDNFISDVGSGDDRGDNFSSANVSSEEILVDKVSTPPLQSGETPR